MASPTTVLLMILNCFFSLSQPLPQVNERITECLTDNSSWMSFYQQLDKAENRISELEDENGRLKHLAETSAKDYLEFQESVTVIADRKMCGSLD